MIYEVNLSKSAEKELYKLPKSYYIKFEMQLIIWLKIQGQLLV